MSNFHVKRKIVNLQERRAKQCYEKYQNFVLRLIITDMGDINLGAYNKDVFGVEVIR